MPEQEHNEGWINASPTKEFFIHTLIRDVPLSRAILDLIDNSVDGARRVRPDGEYQGLKVNLEVTPENFQISDNCGGITIDIARNSAFRFGRPKQTEATPHSIGEFGVGMKRSIFRLGRYFSVESVTTHSKFTVEVDIDEWMSATGGNDRPEWHFQFKNIDTNSTFAEEDTGTTIRISNLHQPIAGVTPI